MRNDGFRAAVELSELWSAINAFVRLCGGDTLPRTSMQRVDGHRHNVRDLVRRGLAIDGPGLPRLTVAGAQAWREWLEEWRAERFGAPATGKGEGG